MLRNYTLFKHMTISELYHIFAVFYTKLGFYTGLSLFIKNFAGRISEAAMGGAGGAQCPALRFKEPKSTGVRTERSAKSH